MSTACARGPRELAPDLAVTTLRRAWRGRSELFLGRGAVSSQVERQRRAMDLKVCYLLAAYQELPAARDGGRPAVSFAFGRLLTHRVA